MTLSLKIEGRFRRVGSVEGRARAPGIFSGAAGAGAAALGSIMVVTVLVIGRTVYRTSAPKQHSRQRFITYGTASRSGTALQV